ncbi:hypothetical protein NE237_013436 [Protea cynaroides]|uniref:Uncharacterized protein n=1 Tax=Protea cynaroides TaxID=273540 RepID=A0A9Q0GZC5_9MAGN|nr:hypothetical protein NE237_013436 [Protea cynaroides]
MESSSLFEVKSVVLSPSLGQTPKSASTEALSSIGSAIGSPLFTNKIKKGVTGFPRLCIEISAEADLQETIPIYFKEGDMFEKEISFKRRPPGALLARSFAILDPSYGTSGQVTPFKKGALRSATKDLLMKATGPIWLTKTLIGLVPKIEPLSIPPSTFALDSIIQKTPLLPLQLRPVSVSVSKTYPLVSCPEKSPLVRSTHATFDTKENLRSPYVDADPIRYVSDRQKLHEDPETGHDMGGDGGEGKGDIPIGDDGAARGRKDRAPAVKIVNYKVESEATLTALFDDEA